MKPIQPPANRTHIVVVGLCMFALLVITVGLGGCNGTPSPNPQATASPTPTPTPKEGPRGDTPIVVKGGGSIDLDFEDYAFPDPGSGKPTCPGCKITSVTWQQLPPGNQPITDAPKECVYTGAPEIVLIETAGNNHNITVEKNNGVQIVFDKQKYPAVVNDCGDEKRRHAYAGVIQKVKVNGQDCTGCRQWQRCKVTIHVF